MDQNPSRGLHNSSARQKIPLILWNSTVPHSTHKCPPSVPVPSQINPVHASTPHFLKIQFNIVLPSKLKYSKWCLSLRPLHQNVSMHLSCSPYVLQSPPISFLPPEYNVRIHVLNSAVNIDLYVSIVCPLPVTEIVHLYQIKWDKRRVLSAVCFNSNLFLPSQTLQLQKQGNNQVVNLTLCIVKHSYNKTNEKH